MAISPLTLSPEERSNLKPLAPANDSALGGGDLNPQQLIQGVLSGEVSGTDITALEKLGALTGAPTAAEKKQKMTKDMAERLITQIENAYLLDVEEPLHYGRIGGAREVINALRGENPSLKNFNRLRISVRPTFARAAGDVGNLSLPEQEAAVALIPTGLSTREEALKQFAEIRKKFNVSPRDLTQIRPVGTGFAEQPVTQPTEPTQAGITPPTVDKGVIKAGGQIAGKFLPFPANLLAAGGVGAATEAGPLQSQRLQQFQAGQVPPYPQQLAESGQAMQKIFGSGVGQTLLQALLSPIKTLGGLRTAAAGTGAATIPGQAIAKGQQQFAQTAPTTIRAQAGRLAEKGAEKFKGKFTPKQILDQLIMSEKTARTLKGPLKTTGAGQFEKATADALRQQLPPDVRTLSTLMRPFMALQQAGQAVKSGVGKAIPFALGGGAVTGLLKLLGVF